MSSENIRTIKAVKEDVLNEVSKSIQENRKYNKELMDKWGKELIENCIMALYTSDVDIYGVMLMTTEKVIDTEISEPTFSSFQDKKGYIFGFNPVMACLMSEKDDDIISMFMHEAMHIAHNHGIEFRLLKNKSDENLKMLSHMGMDMSIFEITEDFTIGKHKNNTHRTNIPSVAPTAEKIENHIREKFNDKSFSLERREGSHYYIEQLVKYSKKAQEENGDGSMFDSANESLSDMVQEAKEKQSQRSEESLQEENDMIQEMLKQLDEMQEENKNAKHDESNKIKQDDIDDFEQKAQEYVDKLDDLNGNDTDTNNDTTNQQKIEEKMNDLLESMNQNEKNNNFDKSNNEELNNKIQEMKSELSKQRLMNSMQQNNQQQGQEDGDGSGSGSGISDMTMTSNLDGFKKYSDPHDINPMENDATEIRMNEQLYDLLENSSSNSRGTIPNHIKEQIDILKRKPKIRWQDYLKSKVGKKRSGKRKTILRRNRRQPYRSDIRGTLPGRKIGKVFAAIDTSGSMSRTEIEEIIAELYYISKEMKIDLVLIFFSSDVEEVVEVSRPNQFNNYVMGRGGTIFSSVFDFLNDSDNIRKYEVSKEDILLFFSDGFGEPEVDYGILKDIIWVITEDENNLSVEDPLGKVLKLEIGE